MEDIEIVQKEQLDYVGETMEVGHYLVAVSYNCVPLDVCVKCGRKYNRNHDAHKLVYHDADVCSVYDKRSGMCEECINALPGNDMTAVEKREMIRRQTVETREREVCQSFSSSGGEKKIIEYIENGQIVGIGGN